MTTFRLKESSISRIFEFSNSYNDAFIHSDDDKVIKAHKLILAIQSPFLHRLFQKKEKDSAQIFLLNIPSIVIENVINLMYGKNVTVSKQYIARFKDLLGKWQVQYRDVDINIDKNDQSKQHHCRDQTQLVDLDKNEMKLNNPTQEKYQDADCNTDSNDEITENSAMNKESFNSTPDITTKLNTEEIEQKGDMEMTNTETAEIENLVGYIHHEIKEDKAGKRQTYKCVVCKTVSIYFQQAKSHFVLFHQENEEEIRILIEAESLRSVASRYFDRLSADIQKGEIDNSVGSLMESTRRVQKVKETLEKVESIKKPVFPPTLKRKKDALIRDFSKFIKLGDEYIDKLENMF